VSHVTECRPEKSRQVRVFSHEPGELIEGVAQGLQARIAFMGLGIGATLESHRSRPGQSLQACRVRITGAILSHFGKPPRRKSLACAWQGAEDLIVFMAQKKARNLLVVVGDLLNKVSATG
jgi:hypothetical protein